MHYGLRIGLVGSLGIWVKIFFSVIWLKLYKKVTNEHTLPGPMADFTASLSEKKAPNVDFFMKIAIFPQKSIHFWIIC